MAFNYSNTVIYKIHCKNPIITDTYIGHTVDFTSRKKQHKYACDNENIQCKLYKTIRANGGWDNWEMVILNTYNCKNCLEARIKEQEHFEEFKPSLNSIAPTCTKPQKKSKILYECKICEYACNKKCNFEKHNLSMKHNLLLNAFEAGKKNAIGSTFEDKQDQIIKDIFSCSCGRIYKHRQGLWRHKRECLHKTQAESESMIAEEFIDTLLNQLKLIKDSMIKSK